MRQTFEDYRAKTIEDIKERKVTAKGIRICLNDTMFNGVASTNYIEGSNDAWKAIKDKE